MSEISSDRLQRLRGDLARKGMDVNEKLTKLLAGQNVTLTTVKLPNEQKPGLKPVEKLRMYLDQIIRAQRRLGTPAFGHCVDCQIAMPDAALDDSPWIERCNACERKA